ncbi:MAG: hypothetical protein JNJ91_13270 [Flavobacteriales bacterium]|nr:hypothetical protein [Flavobacteriales bacterium]
MRKLNFPVVRRVRLSHFSLYTLQDQIEFTLGAGVTCIAGANGLGKSTFLQILNYGLTGVVPRPDQKFASVDDYYRDITTFSRDYFQGRVKPEDREIAEIELEIVIGAKTIKLIRGFDEPDSLRSLMVSNDATDYGQMTPEDRDASYRLLLIKLIGLSSFKELVFIQSFVLTFDERRHLLFWDPKVLEDCLFLFVGVDKDQRAEAEKMRREMERADSRVRNLRWNMTQQKDRLDSYRQVLRGTELTDDEVSTYEEFEKLLDRTKQQSSEVELIEARLRDAKLTLAEAAARATVIRSDYQREFTELVVGRHSVESAPAVQLALIEHKCAICGTEGVTVMEPIKKSIAEHKCPLCKAATDRTNIPDHVRNRLKELDQELAQQKKNVDSSMLSITQLEEERAKRLGMLEAAQQVLSDFEERHSKIVERGKPVDANHEQVIAAYEKTIADIDKERLKQKAKSAEAAKAYKQIQRRLEQEYLSIQQDFVPKFSKLANLFLGVDLDIQLEIRDKSVSLALTVKKTQRRADHDLSESQRFFVDIALRMALASYASPEGNGAPLYIDTPEGSLDLAYEAQAGQMIAEFANDGHPIFMTANINTSALLSEIAKGSRLGFGLQRLYKWRELSEVQEKHESDFENRLNELEKLAHPRKK